ncbi:unnamed protein product [Ostreobium quekettii]|uniref:Uncharacterized protein n=1 Tax=Ostreobium quekettii TaxID=121088 RepID=A0A8S1ISH1_9CHLO|nr:unnamed protein product [Ostreobium quekettii]
MCPLGPVDRNGHGRLLPTVIWEMRVHSHVAGQEAKVVVDDSCRNWRRMRKCFVRQVGVGCRWGDGRPAVEEEGCKIFDYISPMGGANPDAFEEVNGWPWSLAGGACHAEGDKPYVEYPVCPINKNYHLQARDL